MRLTSTEKYSMTFFFIFYAFLANNHSFRYCN